MKEGQYNNPKYKPLENPKVACVMCVYIPKGQTETYSVRSNLQPAKWKPFTENKLESVKFTLACYEHYKSGVDYELILVNNGTEEPETLQYLSDLPYKVYHRENQGWGFGAYKWFWENYGDKYDYFLFHEQDWGPAKNNWLKELLDKFLSEENIGAVGNTVEDRPSRPVGNIGDLKNIIGTDREQLYNFDGAYTFTSTDVLDRIDRIGGLQVLDCEPRTDINAMYNEILFVQPILELGYKITSYHDGKHLRVAGVAILDIENEHLSDKEMAPIIQGNVRFFSKRMHKYFKWYEGK